MAEAKRTCTFPGCSREHKAHGLCGGHYYQHREGDELRPIYSTRADPNASLSEIVDRYSEPGPRGCINWTGPTTQSGHPITGRKRRVHRLVWEQAHGTIPTDMVIDHMCWNPRCVNIDHLQAVTPKQNNENRSGRQRNNTSGVRGVSWDKRTRSWKVKVSRTWIGRFPTLGEASAAASDARRRMFTNSLADMEAE